MFRSLNLAEKGRGKVSPNPMVGCVIVRDGKIIGEGFHEYFGGPHAEVNGIESSLSDVEGAEVFVNLEPCSYHGKTPPCVDLLIEKRVKKVYAAMLDPNPLVNGKGIEKLHSAGIETEVGLLREEAQKLNEIFVKFMTKRLPFVTLKVAQSLDGKIAIRSAKPAGVGRSPSVNKRGALEKYITSKDSLTKVHVLRSQHDAVLVGAGTVRNDDPELTVRLVDGKSPVRVILDGKLSSPVNSRVFSTKEASTVLLYDSSIAKTSLAARRKLSQLGKSGVELCPLRISPRKGIPVGSILRKLAEMNLSSVLVEGGSEVFSQFIQSQMADKLIIFTSPKIFGAGKSFADGLQLRNMSNAVQLCDFSFSSVGPDQMFTAYFRR